jgi:hypothetical protein
MIPRKIANLIKKQSAKYILTDSISKLKTHAAREELSGKSCPMRNSLELISPVE